MTVQTCPGPRNPRTRLPGDCSTAVIAGGTSTCDTSTEKFLTPSACARVTASALAGAVVSNPMAKKTTSRSGCAWASFTASSGAYTMRTSAPCGFQPQEVGPGSGHPKHVAEGREDDTGPLRDRVRLVDLLERRDAHRAAGAMDQLDLRGQQPIDAVLDDGMRLPPAHFHQGPWARHDPPELRQHLGGDPPVAVLVEVLHPGASGVSSSPRRPSSSSSA